jgi:hypothetical protein
MGGTARKANRNILHCGEVGQIQWTIVLRGVVDPHVDFAAKSPGVDWLGQQRLGAILQRLALGLRITISGDHDDRNIRPQTCRRHSTLARMTPLCNSQE